MLGKSFIKIKKSSGPRTDPWGTPWIMLSSSDEKPFTDTYCLQFDK